jgi:tetratricopeptide (TPR) repeat protein
VKKALVFIFLSALARATGAETAPAAVSSGTVESVSDHFRLRVSPGDAFLAEYILPALESAREKAGKCGDVLLSSTTIVVALLSPGQSAAPGEWGFPSPRAGPLPRRWLDDLVDAFQESLLHPPGPPATVLSAAEVRALTLAAQSARDRGHADRAEKLWKQVLAADPNGVEARVRWGRALYDDGRYEEAQAELREALQLQPYMAEIHEVLGLIALDTGNFPAARRSLERALALNPGSREIPEVLKKMPAGPPH